MSSQVRVHGWEKQCHVPFTAPAGAHDAIEIALVEEGTVSYRIGSRDIAVPAGHVVIVPRGFFGAVTGIDGRVRAFAGLSDRSRSSVEAYDAPTNTWTRGTSGKVRRSRTQSLEPGSNHWSL